MKTKLLLGLSLIVLIAMPSSAQPDHPGASPPTFAASQLTHEMQVQARHQGDLLARPGVVGVGLGFRNEQVSLVVLVDRDVPRPSLPVEVEGVPVVTEATDPVVAFNGGDGCSSPGCHISAYSKPIPMGVSTGPNSTSLCLLSGGTLGFKACDTSSGQLGYVTCNHVATITSAGCPNGSVPQVQVQPARFESYPSCTTTWTIATATKRSTISYSSSNTVDAAFSVSDDSYTSRQILDIGYVDLSAGTPTLNNCVRKSGRTSGLTYGRIDMVNTTINVNYGSSCGVAQFVNQFRVSADSTCGTCSNTPCSKFARPGDSGSAIVDPNGFTKKVVGLLFAGNSTGVAYANPVSYVLSNLGVTLDVTQCQ